MVRYISEIRKYDSSLSIGEIKDHIMNEWYSGIDKKTY